MMRGQTSASKLFMLTKNIDIHKLAKENSIVPGMFSLCSMKSALVEWAGVIKTNGFSGACSYFTV
jgi:hypothetical protein